jgi:predicted DNA-binding protein YlxM (UPF0122 family)
MTGDEIISEFDVKYVANKRGVSKQAVYAAVKRGKLDFSSIKSVYEYAYRVNKNVK